MTTIDLTMSVVVGALFTIGLFLLLQRSFLRVLLGFVVLGHGVNLLLLLAGGPPGEPPITSGTGTEHYADPLPQAMALTAIVITFGVTAFLVALTYRAWRTFGHDEVPDDLEDRLIGTPRERASDQPVDTTDTGADEPGGGPSR